MPRPRSIWLVLQLIFLVSGLSALGCQMIWTRRLGFAVGHEAAAMLAVITAFFAGVAAGAWALSPWIATTSRPARAYALLEFVIGGWVAVSPSVLPVVASSALRLLGPAPGAFWHWSVVFALTLVALLPATAAMGATLPALERFASHVTGRPATAGRLYAANTAGAVGGVILGAFVLIPVFGFRVSLWILAALPLLSGTAALVLERAARQSSPLANASHDPPGKAGAPSQPARAANRQLRFPQLLFVAFATGMFGLGLELIGIRLLSQVFENTIYSYAWGLGVFLLGSALGAAFERAFLRRAASAERLGWLLRGLAVATVTSAWTAVALPSLYRTLEARAGSDLADLGVAVALFGFPTVLMGATFSALAHEACTRPGGLSRLVSLNALGAALAPIAFSVVLVPGLGIRWTLVIIAFAYALLAVERRRLDALVLIALALMTLPLPTRFQLLDLPPGARVQTFHEGVADTVAVIATADNHRALRVNNRFTMGGTASANAERRHAHLPLLLHPRPRRVLFLGTGTGITSGAALAYPGLEAETVELVPEVAAVLGAFAPENRLSDWSPRLRLEVADARRFVRTTTNTYDVIIADLFHPARDGAGALYTVEHFAALRARLAPGGLCCQWLPLYQLNEPTLRLLIHTFLTVFPNTHAVLLRLNVDTPVVGLVGTSLAAGYSADWLEQRAADPTLREALKPLALTDTVQLLGLVLAGPDALLRYAQRAPLNTDDRPLVMFTAPGGTGRHPSAPANRLFALLDEFRNDPTDPQSLLAPTAATADFGRRLSQYAAARDTYLHGLQDEHAGRAEAALAHYLESVRLSPDFSTGYAHCLTLAVQQSKENPIAARRILEQLRESQPQRQAAQELLRRLPATGPE